MAMAATGITGGGPSGHSTSAAMTKCSGACRRPISGYYRDRQGHPWHYWCALLARVKVWAPQLALEAVSANLSTQ